MNALPAFLTAAIDRGLPPRPGSHLNPYLDAAEVCVARFGWSRTSPKDIAREAGVERTTIYRHLGAKDQIFRLLIAREVHRIIDTAMKVAGQAHRGAHVVVELTAATIEQVLANPVISKLLADEPELVGGFLESGVPDVIERFTQALSPVVSAGMDAGLIAKRDPVIVTQWVVRVALSLLVAPPPGDLRTFLAEVLGPVLETSTEAAKPWAAKTPVAKTKKPRAAKKTPKKKPTKRTRKGRKR